MKNLVTLLIIISFISCKKDKVYKLSDDICETCNQNSLQIFGKDTVVVYTIITPNGDGYNDFFKVESLDKYPNNSIVFYDRNMNQLSSDSPYYNNWPNQLPTKLSNGLYHYKLTINSNEIVGSVLVLIIKDDYFNIKISDNSCGKKCSFYDPEDPFYLYLNN